MYDKQNMRVQIYITAASGSCQLPFYDDFNGKRYRHIRSVLHLTTAEEQPVYLFYPSYSKSEIAINSNLTYPGYITWFSDNNTSSSIVSIENREQFDLSLDVKSTLDYSIMIAAGTVSTNIKSAFIELDIID